MGLRKPESGHPRGTGAEGIQSLVVEAFLWTWVSLAVLSSVPSRSREMLLFACIPSFGGGFGPMFLLHLKILFK